MSSDADAAAFFVESAPGRTSGTERLTDTVTLPLLAALRKEAGAQPVRTNSEVTSAVSRLPHPFRKQVTIECARAHSSDAVDSRDRLVDNRPIGIVDNRPGRGTAPLTH